MTDREVIKVSNAEAEAIAFGENPDFKQIQESISHTSRWAIHYNIVVQRISDSKYFSSYYSVGATESQDQRPYEYDEPKFTEVFPTIEQITVYK
jgi:hypothetical protein